MSGLLLSSQFDCGSTQLKGNNQMLMLHEMTAEQLQDELHHAHKWLANARHEVEIATARVAVIKNQLEQVLNG